MTDRSHEYHERVAICTVDGGLTEHEAKRVAIEQMSECTQDELPGVWKALNRAWHGLATEVYGRDGMQIARSKIKEKHEVDSFTRLTVGQIQGSIARIRAKMTEKNR